MEVEKMDEYISRQAFKEKYLCCGWLPEMAETEFDDFPAADVVEVRRGRWIKPVPGDGENYCSVCHAEQPWFYGYGYYEPDYCPNCGARMGKEDDLG